MFGVLMIWFHLVLVCLSGVVLCVWILAGCVWLLRVTSGFDAGWSCRGFGLLLDCCFVVCLYCFVWRFVLVVCCFRMLGCGLDALTLAVYSC